MNPVKVVLSLRISHPNKQWNEISSVLNLTPRVKFNKGDYKNPEVKTETHRNMFCTFRLAQETCFVSDIIRAQLNSIAEHKRLFNSLTETGGKCEFFIGVFCDSNTGFEIEQDILNLAADLKINLSFDLYP